MNTATIQGGEITSLADVRACWSGTIEPRACRSVEVEGARNPSIVPCASPPVHTEPGASVVPRLVRDTCSGEPSATAPSLLFCSA